VSESTEGPGAENAEKLTDLTFADTVDGAQLFRRYLMSAERECDRCHGVEYLMVSEGGTVFQWRDNRGNGSIWFCPKCDWGDSIQKAA